MSVELTVDPLEPSIAINPSTGPPRTKVTIAGEGFLAGDIVDLTVAGQVIATVTADSNGSFFHEVSLASKDPTRSRQIVMEAAGRRTTAMATTADPTATFTFQKAEPASPNPEPPPAPNPRPAPELPQEKSVSLSDGMGVDLDSGSVGQAFAAPGVDISVGPGLEGNILDVGDGAAIYVIGTRPERPADCAGDATQSVPLPVRSHLCVLTGQGSLATVAVTRSSATTLTFKYRLWS